MRFGLLITFILFLILPVAVSAQAISDTTAFSVSVSPQYPAPYSQAVISLLSSTLDLNNATMIVSLAGKEIYQGSVRPVSVQMNKAGGIANVNVKITSNGTNYSQAISIQPQDVVLIVEPISSAPVLYKGKPRIPLEGDVRIVAVANIQNSSGKVFNQSDLSYSWTVDNTKIANASGIGKQTIIVASPLQYRSRSISVDVKSQDGTLVGGASLSLVAMNPSVRIYKNDPLLGILFDHALFGNYSINNSESTLYAAPFSLPNTNGAPLFQWFLNGSAVQTGNSITLRPTGSGKGNASLSLVASGGESNRATANLSLSFGSTPGGLFGL